MKNIFLEEEKPLSSHIAYTVGVIIGKAAMIVLFSIIFWWVGSWMHVLPHTVECGACGANVYESWSVPTMDGTGFATVCEKCYDVAVENN